MKIARCMEVTMTNAHDLVGQARAALEGVTPEWATKLADDCDLAAKVLADAGTFKACQAILKDSAVVLRKVPAMADEIERLREFEAGWYEAEGKLSDAEAEAERLRAVIENDADWKFSAKRRLQLFREQRARAEAAEAKLAKAMEALEEAREWMSCVEGHLRDGVAFKADAAKIDATIAAIKGEPK